MNSDTSEPKVFNGATGSDALEAPHLDDEMQIIEQALADRVMRGEGPLARALKNRLTLFEMSLPLSSRSRRA